YGYDADIKLKIEEKLTMIMFKRDVYLKETLQALSVNEDQTIRQDPAYQKLALQALLTRYRIGFSLGLDQFLHKLSSEEKVIYLENKGFEDFLSSITVSRCAE